MAGMVDSAWLTITLSWGRFIEGETSLGWRAGWPVRVLEEWVAAGVIFNE